MTTEAPQWRPYAIIAGLVALALPAYLTYQSSSPPTSEAAPETPPQSPLETRRIKNIVLRRDPTSNQFSIVPKDPMDPGALVNALVEAGVIDSDPFTCATGIVNANPTHITPMGDPLGPEGWKTKLDSGAIDIIPQEACHPTMPVRSTNHTLARAPRPERHPFTDPINAALGSLLEKAGEIHPLLRTYLLYHITLIPFSVLVNFINVDTFKRLRNKLDIGFIYAQYGILLPLLIGVPVQIAIEAIIGTIEGPILSPLLALLSWIGLKNELDDSSINGIPWSDAGRAINQGVNVAETLIERDATNTGQVITETQATVLAAIGMPEMDKLQIRTANDLTGTSIWQAQENILDRRSEAAAKELRRQFREGQRQQALEDLKTRIVKHTGDHNLANRAAKHYKENKIDL